MRQTIAEMTNNKSLPKNLGCWEKENKEINKHFYESQKPKHIRVSNIRLTNFSSIPVFQVENILVLMTNLQKIYKIDYIAELFNCDPVYLRKILSDISKKQCQEKKRWSPILEE